ncbi:MAG: family 65 glycosyl hydrolase, partial [Acidimicrobiales bacterium]
MISHEAFPAQPWCLHESRLELGILAQTESLFALSNGHIGMRANLDEGEPAGLPGTYLNSFYERHPISYNEPSYGYPESSERLVNVTNGKLVRLLVDDEPFDVRYGTLQVHERELDFRSGVLTRRAVWTSPAGRTVEVCSRRLVSFAQRAVAAVNYCVTPLDGPAHVVVQSELVANEPLGPEASARGQPLEPLEHAAGGAGATLLHRTRCSGLVVGAAMSHLVVERGDRVVVGSEAHPDRARTSLAGLFHQGQCLNLVKLLAYGWSSRRSVPALRNQVEAALAGASESGWDGLLAAQGDYLGQFWEQADVEVEGDVELQQAVRFGLFHVLQASARAEQRPIPAKGLTGPGYEGHTFWDMETYVLPLLTYSRPEAAADALRWRLRTLPRARRRARTLGLHGAAFPWRTISGDECSGYWPAGTAAFHVNADIADAAVRYVGA